MANKKIIYLVIHAGSILSAAIAKSHNEEITFIPSDEAQDENPMELYEQLYPGKKVPMAAKWLREEIVSDYDNVEARNLETGIEHYAYDVNDPYQFQSLLNVLNNDTREIKRLSDLGAAINYANRDHDDVIDELVAKHQENINENSDSLDLDSWDDLPEFDSKPEAEPDAEENPEVIPEPAADPIIEAPVESVVDPAIVNSETNTVNSVSEPAAEEGPEATGKTSKKN